MSPLSFARHQFPPAIIQHAIWLYLRFTLSYRDVEELLAERGVEVSYESVRRWVLKFGPAIARNLRRLRPKPSPRWHLDEMVIRVSGKPMYLWRVSADWILAHPHFRCRVAAWAWAFRRPQARDDAADRSCRGRSSCA
ncbi:hypothetical protein GCM10007856_01270 [Azospirillum oryzae]|nr:hypothetical protein GCM10007856_01270 [Azospirillum oryzae]